MKLSEKSDKNGKQKREPLRGNKGGFLKEIEGNEGTRPLGTSFYASNFR
jgi:hypothetical protein